MIIRRLMFVAGAVLILPASLLTALALFRCAGKIALDVRAWSSAGSRSEGRPPSPIDLPWGGRHVMDRGRGVFVLSRGVAQQQHRSYNNRAVQE